MTQWIITMLILIAALAYASWLIYKYFRRRRKGTGPCDEIHGDCAQCLKQGRHNQESKPEGYNQRR